MTEARGWRLALALLLAASTTSCVTHRNRSEEGRLTHARNDMAEAATGPLRDIGLIRPRIPDAVENLRYPYKSDTLAAGCPSISYEIAQLNAVLGEESYQPGRETSLTERGFDYVGDYAENYAVDALRDAVDVVPFQSWVRRLSGADRAQKKAARAIEMGHTRRTFLRGYGAALGCPDVVPEPPPARIERERRRNRDNETQAAAETPAAAATSAAAPSIVATTEATASNPQPAPIAAATPVATPAASEAPH